MTYPYPEPPESQTESTPTPTPPTPPAEPAPTAQPAPTAPPAQPVPPSAPPPASNWRPPPADHGRNVSLVFGVILLILGLWFFADQTLGLTLPDFEWDQLWPIILIGLGAWVLFSSLGRRRS